MLRGWRRTGCRARWSWRGCGWRRARGLAQVLEGAELEEFLLRYSRNAMGLRLELREFNPTAEEFRKMFAAVDPIDVQMQLEFGSAESMSPGQRRRWQSQREAVFRQVLSADRFEAYLKSKVCSFL